jgi:hypothetical protein
MAVGNEDTYKEMMRVKRTVESKFSILPPTMEKIELKLEKEQKENDEVKNISDKYDSEIMKHIKVDE